MNRGERDENEAVAHLRQLTPAEWIRIREPLERAGPVERKASFGKPPTHSNSELRDRFPRLRYLFVGGGSAETVIRAEVVRHGLADRIVFTGFRTDSADLVRAADFSILVSTKEGLSNTLLESLAAGRPVIASRVGGNAEVVSTDVGLLVPPQDPDALAQAVAHLAADPLAAARMGERGRERARREFSVTRMAAETAALYEKLGGRRQLPASVERNAAS